MVKKHLHVIKHFTFPLAVLLQGVSIIEIGQEGQGRAPADDAARNEGLRQRLPAAKERRARPLVAM